MNMLNKRTYENSTSQNKKVASQRTITKLKFISKNKNYLQINLYA